MGMHLLQPKDGLCGWCERGKLPTFRHKYCSPTCNKSAEIYCYPQSLISRGFHLIEYQAGACRGCGTYYGDEILANIEDNSRGGKYKVGYAWAVYGIKGLEVDHIIPVIDGGFGIGIRNHQVLCSICHRRKSASEQSARAKKG